MEIEGEKILRGSASQFYVAAELSRRGVVAALTMGNSPTTDILCTRPDGEGFVCIQVKTFRKGGRSCSVGLKAERNHGPDFFWVLVGLPTDGDNAPIFYVIPSGEMAVHITKCHTIWVKTPGRDGRPHKDNPIRSVRISRKNIDGWEIKDFMDRWDLIQLRLGMDPNRKLAVIPEDDDETDEESP